MKKLIFVRHGLYESRTQNLSHLGEQQIRSTGTQLAHRFFGKKFRILSSSQPRAVQSAEIICRNLGLDPDSVEKHEILYVDAPRFTRGHAEKIRVLLDEIEKKGDVEVVIVVTHLEVIDLFPTYWSHNRGYYLPENEGTPNATALVIDVKEGYQTEIRP